MELRKGKKWSNPVCVDMVDVAPPGDDDAAGVGWGLDAAVSQSDYICIGALIM
jgi:hypothetical protein